MIRRWIQRLTNNLSLKIVALALSVIIWIFVGNNNDPIRSITISNVPITIVNEDSIADIGKVVEPEGSGTVTLKVTERSSVLNRLSRNGSNFYVEADLENINQLNTVPLTVTCDNASVTWDEIAITPSSLKVTIEDKVEQPFAVTVSPTGEPASGYTVGSTEISSGKTLLIAGPDSLVKIINQVTAPVSVSGLARDALLTSTLRVYDRNGAEFTEAQLSRLEFKDSSGALLTDRTLEVQVSLWNIRQDVPIRIETEGEPAEGYAVGSIASVPERVSLAGTQEALEQLGEALTVRDKISLDGASEDLTREIDLSDTLSQYENLKLVGDTDPVISVTVQIEKTDDIIFEIPLGAVELVNKPAEMKLAFTPADRILVDVHPVSDEAPSLRAEQIKASLDLSVCSQEGTYEIPVQIELPEGYELSGSVSVTVSAAAQQTEEAVTEAE